MSPPDPILNIPEIKGKISTYLHPGEYYLTVIADMDGDGLPGPGDLTHPRTRLVVKPESHRTIEVKRLNVKN